MKIKSLTFAFRLICLLEFIVVVANSAFLKNTDVENVNSIAEKPWLQAETITASIDNAKERNVQKIPVDLPRVKRGLSPSTPPKSSLTGNRASVMQRGNIPQISSSASRRNSQILGSVTQRQGQGQSQGGLTRRNSSPPTLSSTAGGRRPSISNSAAGNRRPSLPSIKIATSATSSKVLAPATSNLKTLPSGLTISKSAPELSRSPAPQFPGQKDNAGKVLLGKHEFYPGGIVPGGKSHAEILQTFRSGLTGNDKNRMVGALSVKTKSGENINIVSASGMDRFQGRNDSIKNEFDGKRHSWGMEPIARQPLGSIKGALVVNVVTGKVTNGQWTKDCAAQKCLQKFGEKAASNPDLRVSSPVHLEVFEKWSTDKNKQWSGTGPVPSCENCKHSLPFATGFGRRPSARK